MMKGTTPPFEIPNEMRAVAERSVEQAKLAFNNYMQAAQEAVSTFEERVKASQVGAQGISKKAMSFAERNVLSAFEFAQKIVQAKDIQELVRMQTEFVQSQMQVLSEQVKDLGETATKTAMESVKTPGKGGLSSLQEQANAPPALRLHAEAALQYSCCIATYCSLTASGSHAPIARSCDHHAASQRPTSNTQAATTHAATPLHTSVKAIARLARATSLTGK
jgi:phasin